MTPKQRMLAALRRQPVDRLPAATYNFHPFAAFSEEPGYQPMLEALAQAEHVGVLCKVSAQRNGGRRDRVVVGHRDEGNAQVTVTRIDTPKGPLQTVHRKPKDQPGYCVEPLIKSDDDIARYLSLPAEPAALDLSTAKERYEELAEKGLAYLAYEDPFYAVAHWFDFGDLAVRCMEDLGSIQAMVDREFARIKAELATVLDQSAGYEFLFYTAGPEVAVPPLLVPDAFDRLVTPYQTELVRMIQRAGRLCAIHCHGKVRAVFDAFLGIGADALEPMEPPPQGDVDLAEALERAHGGMCLMGYIQDQDLYLANPGEMRQKVAAIGEIVQDRTGYIMTPSATPFMFPPPREFVRNYIEFLHAAEQPS